MKWPRAFGVVAAVLLPLPLVLLFSLTPHRSSPGQRSVRISPVLSVDVRRQLVTYHRSCQSDADCEAPMGCLAHWKLRTATCTDSECTTDLDCMEGDSCQAFESEGQGPRVRICVTQGRRKEGEPCASLPSSRNEGCEPGLRCLEGWCGRPCSKEEPTSCPEGFFCSEDAVAPSCLPTCQGRSCPDGRQCVQFNTSVPQSQAVSACAEVHGTNCQESPCPAGQRCFHQKEVTHRPGEVWMSCVQDCDDEHPSCPEGMACDTFFCRQLCDPNDASTCGPHLACTLRAADTLWMCRPDYWKKLSKSAER